VIGCSLTHITFVWLLKRTIKPNSDEHYA